MFDFLTRKPPAAPQVKTSATGRVVALQGAGRTGAFERPEAD